MLHAETKRLDRLDRIQDLHRQARRSILVIDDDPTGSQAVHDIRLITDANNPERIAQAATRSGHLTFVLTNSRAIDPEDAGALTKSIAASAISAAVAENRTVMLVSRGDSTLRGHVIDEPAAIASAIVDTPGYSSPVTLFCPAYIEAGRVTLDDIHYITEGAERVPVAQTPFASDQPFGYSTSHLPSFLVERARGALSPEQITSISLHDLRTGGEERVASMLLAAAPGSWLVLNAETADDIEILAEGICTAAVHRPAIVVRSGPSLVRALAGQQPAPALNAHDLAPFVGPEHGLIVVGSHVPVSTQQLNELRTDPDVRLIEIDVRELRRDRDHIAEYQRSVAASVVASLTHHDVVLATSRSVEIDTRDALTDARTIASGVSAIVALVARQREFGWVIGKGGITSHTTAVDGLGIEEGTVLGQLLPGQISALVDPLTSRPSATDLFIIFPGNVGAPGTLLEIVRTLRTAQQHRRELAQ